MSLKSAPELCQHHTCQPSAQADAKTRTGYPQKDENRQDHKEGDASMVQSVVGKQQQQERGGNREQAIHDLRPREMSQMDKSHGAGRDRRHSEHQQQSRSSLQRLASVEYC
jgi:hypothetical protein